MQAQTLVGFSGATNSGLLTAAGAETVYDTTVVIEYAIGGVAYRKAAVTDGATPTTDGDSNALTALTASKGCAMLWCLNAAGTVGVFQGPVRDLDAAGDFELAPDVPSVDLSTWCPFAIQILKAASTAGTITFGSSNWNATGFTNVIKNLIGVPDRVLTS